MADPVYNLGFSPKWVVLDNLGRPAAGGKLYTYSNLNKALPKAAYSDSAGNNPYPNPIIFDANGTKGPIFFKFDSDSPDDIYYLRMYDANNNFLWDMADYTGAGSGSGGTSTTDVDIANLVTNGVFWNTDKPIDVSTFATGTNVRLAPGAHDSFVEGENLHGPTGPDIVFAKNNMSATDTLQFISFVANDIPAPDITPQYYLEYNCSIGGSNENYKYIQFPITPKVRNLSNTTVTAVIYAKGTGQIQLSLRQFYGDGPSATAEIFPFTPIGSAITLTNTWTRYSFSATVPNVDAIVIGECHNDALFLCVGLPRNSVSTVDITKAALYNGTFNPPIEFLTMDQIDAVTMTPRVGDIKTSISNVVPFGYLPMNDGTIGSTTSGGTTRANTDTFALFSTIWKSCQANPTYAPIYTSGGALSTYGATAQDDFAANKQISLTKSLGQVMAGMSTVIDAVQTYTADFTSGQLTVATNAVRMGTGVPVILSNSGGAAPAGLSVGVVYYSIFVDATHIKLATTVDNAVAGTAIAFTGNGTGTQSIIVYSNPLAQFQGEKAHTLISSELPDPLTSGANSARPPGGGGGTVFFILDSATDSTAVISNSGGNQPHNNMQPTTFMNVFIKY